MTTKLGHFEGATVLRLDERNLDAASAETVETALKEALSANPLVLDLSRVRFADSSGLGLLTDFARGSGERLRIARPHPALRRCLGRVAVERLPQEVELPETLAPDSVPLKLQLFNAEVA